MATPTIAAPRPLRACRSRSLSMSSLLSPPRSRSPSPAKSSSRGRPAKQRKTSPLKQGAVPDRSRTPRTPKTPKSPDAPSEAPLVPPPAPSSAPKTPTAPPSRVPSRPPSRTERRFACDHSGCDKAYFKPSRLAEHKLTHTGERPHACTECDQTYLRASHLTAHMRTHRNEDEKPFTCPRDNCGKRFWTATHLRRHEEAHNNTESHACEKCEETFPKSHLLREHCAAEHMPPGSKPWPCTHEGCGKTFAAKQQLRTHEKTHDPTRYMCSHPSHGDDMPMFPVWSALQSHIRDAHPPTCPHAECAGRSFKSGQRLREHLRVHAEREADLARAVVQGENDDEEPLPPVIAEMASRRKRRRSEHASGAESPRKLPRIQGGEAGKEWACGAPHCGARFKTRFARDEHSQAAHVRKRHVCATCGRSYRRPASLRRHEAQGWCTEDGEEEDWDKADGADESVEHAPDGAKAHPDTHTDENLGALLTGAAMLPGGSLHRRWGCPWHAEDEDDDDEDECAERFHRVYDVRRHLQAVHGVVVDDAGTREMLLADGQTGEEPEL